MTNTIYFKDDWLYPFKSEDTTDKPFYLDKRTKKIVPMMFKYKTGDHKNGYIEELKAKWIELVYKVISLLRLLSSFIYVNILH